MGIKEFIAAGNQQISSLISKIRQIEILRVQLQEIVDYVSQKNLLKLIMDNQDKATTLPAFDAFFKSTYDHLEKMYKDVLGKVALMSPLLIKVEEILGMVSHKMSLITIFGHITSILGKNFIKNLKFIMKKLPTSSDFDSYLVSN